MASKAGGDGMKGGGGALTFYFWGRPGQPTLFLPDSPFPPCAPLISIPLSSSDTLHRRGRQGTKLPFFPDKAHLVLPNAEREGRETPKGALNHTRKTGKKELKNSPPHKRKKACLPCWSTQKTQQAATTGRLPALRPAAARVSKFNSDGPNSCSLHLPPFSPLGRAALEAGAHQPTESR